jgi:hypothetical protein
MWSGVSIPSILLNARFVLPMGELSALGVGMSRMFLDQALEARARLRGMVRNDRWEQFLFDD